MLTAEAESRYDLAQILGLPGKLLGRRGALLGLCGGSLRYLVDLAQAIADLADTNRLLSARRRDLLEHLRRRS